MTTFERIGASVSAYPLSWPTGWPRSKWRKPANFGRADTWTVARARDELLRNLELLRAAGVVLSTNLELRRDGLPAGGQRQPQDPGASVWFQLEKKPRVLACDRWDKVEHNIRALALHIEALRGMDRWGVGSVDQAFGGYTQLPETAGSAAVPWWDVLEVDQHAQLEEIEAAYRRLALQRHPDRGGSHEQMTALNAARAAARDARVFA